MVRSLSTALVIPPRRASVHPAQEYGLWRFLMEERRLRLLETRASIWIDLEDQADTSVSARRFERVDEVCLHVS
jgi:hypothetical protein